MTNSCDIIVNYETANFIYFIVSEPIGNLNTINNPCELIFETLKLLGAFENSYRTRLFSGEYHHG
jgi:hypothetical protein